MVMLDKVFCVNSVGFEQNISNCRRVASVKFDTLGKLKLQSINKPLQSGSKANKIAIPSTGHTCSATKDLRKSVARRTHYT